ncbi:unnamed protein product [Penicillium salamii]|uniref:Thioredoxin domain-containing protein n=1 Tax=Penicillium salamii TaxID=1612424 RepID=A0A9W4ITS5_9EURO|nr:unnamed protein product [Penicillium salamii]CAG8043821.1 unnamed protein product [Penicillium salamii]CAG8334583.1 unnamed protein product [Penicillium salamii]CAG8334857.1 unnamed protein product [Penicillium salamii]CAG8343286.1 unnamed protein product [Penicillium salamii]
MTILKFFTLPTSAKELLVGPGSKFFIAFISGSDPITKQAWCPDVRAAMPSINAAFAGDDTPELAIVEVGQKPEWNNPQNVYRTTWATRNIPALVRYQQVDGEVIETGRLVEGEILNEQKLQDFMA